jgi:hypothetical protein
MIRTGVLAAMLAGALAPAAPADAPSVKDVMRRVGAYVDGYGEKASIVVATEQYSQQARSMRIGYEPVARRLVSDFAIVKIDALRGWQGFRDVLEVDGEQLPDRADRLVRLLTAAGGRYDEARQLSDESARFNIGSILRNFNVPTTALFFFSSGNLDRFKFSAKGVDASGIWEIAFRETWRPTLIRTPEGVPVPSEGSLWVNPADGTVVRTELRVAGFVRRGERGTKATGRVDVTYSRVSDLDMWLPSAMDEDFETVRADGTETISGRALYSNYRQFRTMVRIK